MLVALPFTDWLVPVVARVTTGFGILLLVLAMVITIKNEKKIQHSMEEGHNIPIIRLPDNRHLSLSHRITLGELSYQMEHIHGHSDRFGLEVDLRGGILGTDLLERNCTRCGKPRNKKGDSL